MDDKTVCEWEQLVDQIDVAEQRFEAGMDDPRPVDPPKVNIHEQRCSFECDWLKRNPGREQSEAMDDILEDYGKKHEADKTATKCDFRSSRHLAKKKRRERL